MRILVDMNLSPRWTSYFERNGLDAVHWSDVGDPRAPDSTLMGWATIHGYLVFTHDLDFGAILATSQATGPSVIQLRAQDVLPERVGPMILRALREHQSALEAGALLVLDEDSARVRVLPLRR